MYLTHYRPFSTAYRPWRHATDVWTPAVDIDEREDSYVIHADVPGVKAEDLDITVEKGVLSIVGERKHETETEADGYRRQERGYGRFERRFALPDAANDEEVEATVKNGVLEVQIAKRPETKPRKIEVKH